jgi:hypothetical protein
MVVRAPSFEAYAIGDLDGLGLATNRRITALL